MIYIFAKNRVWLLWGLAGSWNVMLNTWVRTSKQCNSGKRVPTVFPLLLDSTLFDLWALVGFLVTVSSHDSENIVGSSWILYVLASFWGSLTSSGIPSIPLFPSHFSVNCCWLIIMYLQGLKSKEESYLGIVLQNHASNAQQCELMSSQLFKWPDESNLVNTCLLSATEDKEIDFCRVWHSLILVQRVRLTKPYWRFLCSGWAPLVC